MLGAWSIFHATESMLTARFAAALAKSLAGCGKRVLLFDLSPEVPALDVLLGLDGRVVYTLSDAERIAPRDILLTPSENFFFVPIGVGETVNDLHISACIQAASPDVVLFAAARSTVSLARALSDGALLLTDASAVSLRAAIALVGECAFDGFVLGDFVPVREEIEKMPSLTEMADALGIPLFGVLPKTSLYDTHTASEKSFLLAAGNMAGRLMGENIPLLRGIPLEGMRRKRFFTRISE